MIAQDRVEPGGQRLPQLERQHVVRSAGGGLPALRHSDGADTKTRDGLRQALADHDRAARGNAMRVREPRHRGGDRGCILLVGFAARHGRSCSRSAHHPARAAMAAAAKLPDDDAVPVRAEKGW